VRGVCVRVSLCPNSRLLCRKRLCFGGKERTSDALRAYSTVRPSTQPTHSHHTRTLTPSSLPCVCARGPTDVTSSSFATRHSPSKRTFDLPDFFSSSRRRRLPRIPTIAAPRLSPPPPPFPFLASSRVLLQVSDCSCSRHPPHRLRPSTCPLALGIASLALEEARRLHHTSSIRSGKPRVCPPTRHAEPYLFISECFDGRHRIPVLRKTQPHDSWASLPPTPFSELARASSFFLLHALPYSPSPRALDSCPPLFPLFVFAQPVPSHHVDTPATHPSIARVGQSARSAAPDRSRTLPAQDACARSLHSLFTTSPSSLFDLPRRRPAILTAGQ
jgi:hypothetical protein